MTYDKEKTRTIWFLLLVVSCWLLAVSFVNAASVYEGTSVPYIHPRSEWLHTPELQNLFTWYPESPTPEGKIPDYTKPNVIILHDTGCNQSRAGCNDETMPTASTLQNMFRFHAVTRGWGDIGYNFIIDRKGEIWEGRYGGVGVRGAHLYSAKTCQNFNVGSIGITLIGNYYDAKIPDAMMESLTKLLAWLSVTNDIDLSRDATMPVWTNPKDEKGKCVLTLPAPEEGNGESAVKEGVGGGFTTTYAGSPVMTHRDIVPANSDIKNIDLIKVKEHALAFVPDVKEYAYQGVGDTTTYEITGSVLKAVASTAKKVISIIKNQLDYFRPELFAKKSEPKITTSVAPQTIPDGTLLNAKGQEDVYFIKDQKRFHISSARLFEALGFRWDAIRREDASIVNGFPLENPILFPDGTLIKSEPPDVYFIQQGKRFLISSANLFKALAFNWTDIVNIPLSELDRYAWGGYVKWPDGTILQNQYNKAQVFTLKEGNLEPLQGAIPSSSAPAQVTGREIQSYQVAQVASPTITLALAQAYEKIKSSLGIATVNASPQISPASSPPSPPSQSSPPPSTPSYPAPSLIKIALCKNRDINNCAFSKTDTLSMKDNANGTVTVEGYEDHPGFNPSLNDNIFRGKLSLVPSSEPDKLWIINELPFEDYLKGIAETLATDAPQYRKAHTLMARTYAYYYLTQEKRYPDKPYDLTNTSSDQVYRGYNYENRSGGLPAIVEETKGQIITYQGKPIVAAYSSDSGGITKDACSLWQKYCDSQGKLKAEFAYLKGGVTDPEGTVHDAAKIKASHGVGVSATGARRLVELSKTFSEVLVYYYLGVEITKAY